MNKFLNGQFCYLRSLTENDANGNYSKWFNDKETTKYMKNGTYPMTNKDILFWIEHSQTSKNDLILAICDNNTDTHVGNIGIHRIDWIFRTGEYGIIIGEKEYWGKGIAHEASKLIIQYVFDYFNLNRVWLGVVKNNIHAVNAFKKIGFIEEGTERESFYKHGQYFDVLRMGLLKKEFKVV